MKEEKWNEVDVVERKHGLPGAQRAGPLVMLLKGPPLLRRAVGWRGSRESAIGGACDRPKFCSERDHGARARQLAVGGMLEPESVRYRLGHM